MRHLLSQSPRELGPIEGFDDVEQRDRFFHLIGLEMTDEMERGIWNLRFEQRPFVFRLLNAILPKLPVPGVEDLLDTGRFMGFGDRNQGYGIGSSPGTQRNFANTRANPRKILSS